MQLITGSLPYVTTNGTMGGTMMTQLQSGEADMVGMGTSLERRLTRVLSYLQPTHQAL